MITVIDVTAKGASGARWVRPAADGPRAFVTAVLPMVGTT